MKKRSSLKLFLILSILLFSCGYSVSAQNDVSVGHEASALPRIVDFGAHQCKACKAMVPVLEKLQKDYADKFKTEFVDVWVKENVEQARANNIESIPTQVFFSPEGKELFRNTGFFSEEDILQKWAELGYKFVAETPAIKEEQKPSSEEIQVDEKKEIDEAN